MVEPLKRRQMDSGMPNHVWCVLCVLWEKSEVREESEVCLEGGAGLGDDGRALAGSLQLIRMML